MTREEKLRIWYHIPHGMGISLPILAALRWGWPLAVLGVAWCAMCMFYQWMEDWRIKDNSYLDIRGYMTGMAAGVGVWLTLWLNTLWR